MSTVKRRVTSDSEPERALAEAGHPMGERRRRVLAALRDMGDRATAEELAAALPDVHLATVYRTLHLLEELGVVSHVHLAHGPAVFELTSLSETSRHLVCERCGAHVTVPAALFDDVAARLDAEYGFVLDTRHFALVGHCRACADSPD